MNKPLEAEEFLRAVANHQMTVELDQGIYRNIVFKNKSNSWNQWFGITTWPGYLTIYGDMGTWTFARVQDMFNFFRESELRINSYYWSEKLQHGAFGGRDGAKVFSEDLFRKQLLERVTDWGLEEDKLASVTEALKDDVLYHDNKYELMVAARDFKHDGFYFDELPDGKEYSIHFLWCCYAIVWGIQQYDALKATQTPPGRAEESPAKPEGHTEAKT